MLLPSRDPRPRRGPGQREGGGRAAEPVTCKGGAQCPQKGGREVRAGIAGRRWEEGMCVVGKGLLHVLGLAFIVQEEKRNQEKYQAFHTLMKCETSRVIKPLKGKVRY